MSKIKMVWDSANDSSWASEYIFEKDPILFIFTENNFEQTIISTDNTMKFYTIGQDNLSAKREWNIVCECSNDQHDNLQTIFNFTRNKTKTNRYIRFYPDNSSATYYNCVFTNKWEEQYSNRLYGTSAERYTISFIIKEK